MGVRVEVGDGEAIGPAFRRFMNLVRRFGPPGAGGPPPKWHKRPHDHHLKPSQLARRVKLRTARLTYNAECARRGLDPAPRGVRRGKVRFGLVGPDGVPEDLYYRGVKRGMVRFGDAPLLDALPDPLIPPWYV